MRLDLVARGAGQPFEPTGLFPSGSQADVSDAEQVIGRMTTTPCHSGQRGFETVRLPRTCVTRVNRAIAVGVGVLGSIDPDPSPPLLRELDPQGPPSRLYVQALHRHDQHALPRSSRDLTHLELPFHRAEIPDCVRSS